MYSIIEIIICNKYLSSVDQLLMKKSFISFNLKTGLTYFNVQFHYINTFTQVL